MTTGYPSPAQYAILKCILESGTPLTTLQVCEVAGVSISNARSAINKLLKRGKIKSVRINYDATAERVGYTAVFE